MTRFLARINKIKWFLKCGNAANDYVVISSIFDVYDNHNAKMLITWEPEICALENEAKEIITDEKIDYIFDTVSNTIQNALWNGYCNFIERRRLENETGLEREILACVKRDISWAAIELQIGQRGFFNDLLGIYEQGRWPCSYEGIYSNGKFVVM